MALLAGKGGDFMPNGYGPMTGGIPMMGGGPMAGGFGNPFIGGGVPFWWGAPFGWTDVDLYDYNNNFVLDDDEITALVKDNIESDPFIPPYDSNNIKVEIKNRVVTLSGTVKTPRSKPLSYADAFWSSGVSDVFSNVEVAPMERKEGQRMKGK